MRAVACSSLLARPDRFSMEPNREIVRHWILNLAIEGSRKISDFVPHVFGEHLNVLPVSGAAPHHYSDAFFSLFDEGLVHCFRDEDDEQGKIAVDRAFVESVLNARLRFPQVTSRRRLRVPGPVGSANPDLEWRLTSVGGKEWERLAQPNWERFVFMLFAPLSAEGSAKGGDAWSANLDSLMTELGWCREFNGEEVDRQSLRVEVLRDYPIVYWRTLPIVYHATFLSKWGRDETDFLRNPRADWFRDWWISRRAWYREPWALPAWPTTKNDA